MSPVRARGGAGGGLPHSDVLGALSCVWPGLHRAPLGLNIRRLRCGAALTLADNAAPEQTLFVGDSLTADIHGAEGAGLTPIYLNIEGNGDSPPGIVTIRQLSELLTLLRL